MSKVLIAAIAAAAISAATLAQAADLPRRYAPAYDEGYAAPPAFTWTGFYAGGTAGVGFGGFNGPGARYFGDNPSGLQFGLTGGYNYQSGNLLFGLEGDYAWSHIADSASPLPGVTSSGNVQNLSTARARFGYSYDRALFFATGGYAGANIRGVLNNGPAGSVADQSQWANGFALGLGVEYALTARISAKAEYLYTSLSSNSYFVGTPNPTNVGANINILRGGVNYHF